jgi:hypothetical protein
MRAMMRVMMRVMMFATMLAGSPWLSGCGGSPTNAPTKPADDLEQPPPVFSEPTRGRLAVGERVPNLECRGWLNGEFTSFGEGVSSDPPSVSVVDVWSSW